MGVKQSLARLLAGQPFARRAAVAITRELALAEARAACRSLSPASRVLRGPFAGMSYPTLESAGSALFPKLLGSYEDELHVTFDALLRAGFRRVANVGCGEGYFAVGLARANPTCEVIAFDLDPRATALCRRLAEANGVADRVHLPAPEPTQRLRANFPAGVDLVVCDCEGCEAELFTPELLPRLAKATVIIEIHDDEVGDRIARDAAASHRVQWVESRLKHLADYSETRALPPHLRRDALLTERDARQRWLVLTPAR